MQVNLEVSGFVIASHLEEKGSLATPNFEMVTMESSWKLESSLEILQLRNSFEWEEAKLHEMEILLPVDF